MGEESIGCLEQIEHQMADPEDTQWEPGHLVLVRHTQLPGSERSCRRLLWVTGIGQRLSFELAILEIHA